MDAVLVCIPARRQDSLVPEEPVQAFTPNQHLLDALGYTAEMDEEADYGALVIASVWGLGHHGQRCVLTAQVRPDQLAPGQEAENGGVLVRDLQREQLVAFFTDPDEDPAAAARASANLGIDEAWELPEVQALLDHELQWHDLAEWSR